jgi:endodeoxyribonuclease RalR
MDKVRDKRTGKTFEDCVEGTEGYTTGPGDFPVVIPKEHGEIVEEEPMDKLKPCPFCGCDALMVKATGECFVIRCNYCGVQTAIGGPKTVTGEWNRRVLPSPRGDIMSALNGLVEELEGEAKKKDSATAGYYAGEAASLRSAATRLRGIISKHGGKK